MSTAASPTQHVHSKDRCVVLFPAHGTGAFAGLDLHLTCTAIKRDTPVRQYIINGDAVLAPTENDACILYHLSAGHPIHSVESRPYELCPF